MPPSRVLNQLLSESVSYVGVAPLVRSTLRALVFDELGDALGAIVSATCRTHEHFVSEWL